MRYDRGPRLGSFVDLRDLTGQPNGSDIAPLLRQAIDQCLTRNVRRILLPGSGGATGSHYYSIASDVVIPPMPIVHAGAPIASLRMEGDHWGNTLLAGPGTLRTQAALELVGLEMSAHVQLDVGGPTQYPHFFENCEFNSATIFANVPSRVYLINSRMQFNGGWAVLSQAIAGSHHSVYCFNTELSVAYILGSTGAAYVADEITVVGGKAGLTFPFTDFIDANGTIAAGGLKVAGAGSLTDRLPSLRLASGATYSSGTGAPTIAGAVGDIYDRTDTPGTVNQRQYRCTVAGAAGAATWVAVL